MSTLHDEPLPQETRRLMSISVASWNFPLPLPLLRFGILVMFASLQFYLYTCNWKDSRESVLRQMEQSRQ